MEVRSCTPNQALEREDRCLLTLNEPSSISFYCDKEKNKTRRTRPTVTIELSAAASDWSP